MINIVLSYKEKMITPYKMTQIFLVFFNENYLEYADPKYWAKFILVDALE